jgi:hypothetical protein
MAMEGFFELQTLEDLLRKLERDYARLQQIPEDTDVAYHFFVTAENMLEWVKEGGKRGKTFKRQIQQQHLILTLCHELATGAKHFTSGTQKPAVAETRYEGVFERGVFEPGIYEACLCIVLSPQQAAQRGKDTIDALTLAGEVLAFWQRHLTEQREGAS